MNIFNVKGSNKSANTVSEQISSTSQHESPLLQTGRAGRLQRQNALPKDVRYNAHPIPSSSDRSRAGAMYHGDESSTAAHASTSGGWLRQNASREHKELAQFHEMMQSSPKMLRNASLPNAPERIPARLQQKIDSVDLPKLKKLDQDLYSYAKLATDLAKTCSGTNEALTHLDIKMLPLIADAENARNPGLNLHIFKGPDECFAAIKNQNKQVWSRKQPMNMRVIFPPFKGMPDHHVALDLQFRPGHRPSVVCFESAPGHLMHMLESLLQQSLKGAKIKAVPNIIQQSNWDCSMFALNNALKSFKHYDEYTARLHKDEQNLQPPPEFLKHAQSKSLIEKTPHRDTVVTKDKGGLHSETLLHRNLAFRAKRDDIEYSTSIEGFRFQEIARASEFLASKKTGISSQR